MASSSLLGHIYSQSRENKNPHLFGGGTKCINLKFPFPLPRRSTGETEAEVLTLGSVATNHSGAAASGFHRLALPLGPQSPLGTSG